MAITEKDIKKFQNIDRGIGLTEQEIAQTATRGRGDFVEATPMPLPSMEIVKANTDLPAPGTSTSDTIQKYLFPVAAIGLGILLLTNKRKNLSGMKLGLNAKDFGKKLLPELEHISLVAGGMIASQKFLDLAMLPDKLPDNIKSNTIVVKLVEHQGAVKMAIGIGMAGMSKNPMVKALGYGVAIGGLIKEIRTLTGGATSWIPSIGAPGSIFPGANVLKNQAFNTVLNGNNPAQNRSQNTVLGMTPPTPSTIGCGNYGGGY